VLEQLALVMKPLSVILLGTFLTNKRDTCLKYLNYINHIFLLYILFTDKLQLVLLSSQYVVLHLCAMPMVYFPMLESCV
jgi:hypothetical protein